jgi:hydroxymethylbilane synthase
MPLAAHARFDAQGQLRLQVVLGDGEQPERTLLKAEVSAPVADAAAARALGTQAADALRAQGADRYLPQAG